MEDMGRALSTRKWFIAAAGEVVKGTVNIALLPGFVPMAGGLVYLSETQFPHE